MDIDTTVFIDNCGPQMTAFIVVIILIQCAKLLRYITKKAEVKNKAVKWVVKKLYNFFSYNYLIRTFILLYLYFIMSAILTVRDVQFDNLQQAVSYIFGLIGFLFLILFIFTVFSIIQKYTPRILSSKTFKKKIDCIIADIDFKKKNLARFYIPIYLLRRAVFGATLVVFGKDCPVIVQFVCLVAHCVAMLTAAVILRPYEDFVMNMTAIFNEVMITVIMSFSGTFMIKDMHNDTALNLGWVWIALASFTIIANWVIVLSMFRRKKIQVDEPVKKATTVAADPKAPEPKSNDDSSFDHNFDDTDRNPDTPGSCMVKYNDKTYESPEATNKTMASPVKKNGEQVIENHYNDYVGEDEKQHPQTEKKHKRRKISSIDDEYAPFGYTPTRHTYASPNRVMSPNVSDDVQSGNNESGFSVQLMGETEYPETAPSKQDRSSSLRKPSDDIISYSSSVREFPDFNSNKNILRVRNMSQ
jgi:hypothetical protein